MTCGIYCIENLINNKKYIGKSYDIEKRWGNHKSQLLNKNHDNDHLQKSWNKYGDEYFNFFIIEECSEEKLIEKEMFYIFYFDAKDNGYNMTDGGDGCCGYKHSYEELEKMSKWQKGIPKSEEAIKKMSQSLKGRKAWNKGIPVTKETKNKMSKKKIRRMNPNDLKKELSIIRIGNKNSFFGKTHSEEVRKKISEAKKEYWEDWRLENGR
jgi:group I intron endonuclease